MRNQLHKKALEVQGDTWFLQTKKTRKPEHILEMNALQMQIFYVVITTVPYLFVMISFLGGSLSLHSMKVKEIQQLKDFIPVKNSYSSPQPPPFYLVSFCFKYRPLFESLFLDP